MCRFKDGELLAWTTKWLHELPMLSLLLGQQRSANHWTKKDWPVRDQLNVGEKNVIAEQWEPRDKIVFPPLHIKLGLMEQFVKPLDKDGDCFQYICKSFLGKSFPSLSNEKLKYGIFDGP